MTPVGYVPGEASEIDAVLADLPQRLVELVAKDQATFAGIPIELGLPRLGHVDEGSSFVQVGNVEDAKRQEGTSGGSNRLNDPQITPVEDAWGPTEPGPSTSVAFANGPQCRPVLAPRIFANFADWMKDYVLVKFRPSVVESKFGILCKYLVPAFGDLPLHGITPERIDRLAASMKSQPQVAEDQSTTSSPCCAHAWVRLFAGTCSRTSPP